MNVQTGLLALVFGFSLALWLIRLRILRTSDANSPIPDILLTGGMFILEVRGCLTSPDLLWNDPMKLLFVTGSSEEVLLVTVASAIYVYWQKRKHQLSVYALLDAAAFGALTPCIYLFSAFITPYMAPNVYFKTDQKEIRLISCCLKIEMLRCLAIFQESIDFTTQSIAARDHR